MNATFKELLDQALSEIFRRDGAYASRFPLALPDASAAAAICAGRMGKSGLAAKLEPAMAEGFSYLARFWPAGLAANRDSDLLGESLCASIADAYLADEGLLTLKPSRAPQEMAAEILAKDFAERRLSSGARYFVGKRGTRPLFLIHAAGIPIDIWRSFLSDTAHDFKIVVPERASGDLFAGGLQRNIAVADEAGIFDAIVERESPQGTAVLAWCNGARVAVELTRRCAERISSLVLIAPTLRSRGKEMAADLCPFEIGLHPVLEGVAARPELAPVLAHTISQQSQTPDWEALAKNPARRVEALFRLASKDIAPGLMAPLATGASLLTLARQVPADEDYPLVKMLSEVQIPVMLILGRHDQIVSNAFTAALIRKSGLGAVSATLDGAGHYLHDLQYPYFMLLLREFLHRNEAPKSARISRRDEKPSVEAPNRGFILSASGDGG